jgi:S-methylmethionine-dependent homocysteine/selenocysteine methylase
MLDAIMDKLNRQPYLTDSGLETTLVFHEELELPFFAAFTLLDSKEGTECLKRYYRRHMAIAANKKAGFILDTPTWRANPDWAQRLNMKLTDLQRLNSKAVEELKRLQNEASASPTLISGCLGPRGDGYQPEYLMSSAEAQTYHQQQISWLKNAGADLISAVTLCYPEEAIGITRAANQQQIPVVISFTVETDGHLINGMSLQQAIESVDEATNNGPLYYMVNCAHPTHFQDHLKGERWLNRIQGIRANASTKSHEELDNSETLDAGDPLALGQSYRSLQDLLPNLKVYGGCCGTDHRHIEAISHACL